MRGRTAGEMPCLVGATIADQANGVAASVARQDNVAAGLENHAPRYILMHESPLSERGGEHHQDAILFARNQRAWANEFARAVWRMVRNRQCRDQKFRREHAIPPYTADFCCVALQLIVEVDGEDHYTAEGRHRDQQRDRWLAKHGYVVLRIPGFQVLRDPDSVRKLIEHAIDQRLTEFRPNR